MMRLLVDVVRRGWAVLAIMGGVAFLSAGHLTQHPVGTSVALVLALFLGAHLIETFLPLRPIHVLPITTRDRWRAALGVMAAAVPLTWFIGSLAGMLLPWGRGSATVEPLVIVTLFTALYSTAALLWLPAFQSAVRLEPTAEIDLKGTSRRPKVEAKGFGRMLLLLGVAIALLLAPLRWSHLVPLQFADFSPLSSALFVVVGLLALGAILWTPPDTTLQPARGLSADVLGPPDRYTLFHKRRLDRLTGPARILVPSIVGVTLATLGVQVLTALFGYFVVADSTDLTTALREVNLLVFEQYQAGGRSSGRGTVVILIVILALGPLFGGLHRLLTVLPTSRQFRIALPVLGQASVLTGIWAALISFHVLVTGSWPASVAAEMWVFAVGATSLLHALADRFNWSSFADTSGAKRGVIIGSSIGGTNIIIAIWSATIPAHIHAPLVLTIGLVSLVGALALRGWRGGEMTR
jgi:hypothetical protein